MTVILILGASACAHNASRTPARIVLDGLLADWNAVEPSAGSARSADRAGGLGRLWVTNDEYSLLVRFEVAPEMSIQTDNQLELCLDTDDDAGTGDQVHGIGAELCWRFGDRRGTVVTADGTTEITYQYVGLITAPTVTATDFEIGLALDAKPGGVPLFPGETLKLVLYDGTSHQTLPTTPGGIPYTLQRDAPPPLPPIDIARYDAGHVRLLSYNLNNHLTDPERRASLARILDAIDADIILLQEIRDTPKDEAVDYVLELLPRDDEDWHTVKIGGESTLVLSKFPIVRADSLGDSGGLVLGLPTQSAAGRKTGGIQQMLLVALSLPCCDEYHRRAAEADLIASYVRDAKSGVGGWQIPEGSPIIIMGDANLVGLSQDRRTLQFGEIVDTATYGPRSAPDWDGTPLSDLVPRNTNMPQTFTWIGDEFPPGRLDYVFYSDSRWEIGNRFVLHTPSVPDSMLVRWGLEASDTDVVTDHLPVVADLIVDRAGG